MTSSLIRIGVSLGEVFGLVDRGSRAFSPSHLYAASQRSTLRLPCGHTFITSLMLVRPSAMGTTQRNRSSLIVRAIRTAISRLYRVPPYVCTHYHFFLIFMHKCGKIFFSKVPFYKRGGK